MSFVLSLARRSAYKGLAHSALSTSYTRSRYILTSPTAATVSMAPRRKIPPIEVQISTTIDVTEDLIVDDFPSLAIPPEISSPKRSKRTRSPRKKEEAWDYPDADPDDSPLTDLDDDFDASPSKKKKVGKAGTTKRKRKNQEPVVYDIPPVEPKETSFKGQYFFWSSYGDSPRFCRFRSFGIRMS